MIHLFFTRIQSEWTDVVFDAYFNELPTRIVDSIKKKRIKKDRQLSMIGKLLLKRMLGTLTIGETLNLDNLSYSSFGKPYFPGSALKFNIAHSHNMVVCVAGLQGEMGIDIELIRPVHLDDFTDYFVAEEWDRIYNNPNKHEGFFEAWTRKEAFIKATGTGMSIPLESINTVQPALTHDNKTFFISEVNIARDYKCHVASEAVVPTFTLKQYIF